MLRKQRRSRIAGSCLQRGVTERAAPTLLPASSGDTGLEARLMGGKEKPFTRVAEKELPCHLKREIKPVTFASHCLYTEKERQAGSNMYLCPPGRDTTRDLGSSELSPSQPSWPNLQPQERDFPKTQIPKEIPQTKVMVCSRGLSQWTLLLLPASLSSASLCRVSHSHW